MIKLLASKNDKPLQSLIFNCKSTNHCGICLKNDSNITSPKDWIICDGPRFDNTGVFLCNQCYHYKCIKNSIKNGTSIEVDLENEKGETAFFGHRCNHGMWYKNLNDTTKQYVITNLKYTFENM